MHTECEGNLLYSFCYAYYLQNNFHSRRLLRLVWMKICTEWFEWFLNAHIKWAWQIQFWNLLMRFCVQESSKSCSWRVQGDYILMFLVDRLWIHANRESADSDLHRTNNVICTYLLPLFLCNSTFEFVYYPVICKPIWVLSPIHFCNHNSSQNKWKIISKISHMVWKYTGLNSNVEHSHETWCFPLSHITNLHIKLYIVVGTGEDTVQLKACLIHSQFRARESINISN